MRLLDARALIHEGVARLVDDAELGQPLYAILSHTWGREEVLFEDIKLGPDHEVAPAPPREDRWSQGYGRESRHPWKGTHSGMQRKREPMFTESVICRDCWQSLNRPIPDRASGRPHAKVGWNKVYNACFRACYDSLDYIWIDNCCINKDSSAELTEAINAMYSWYADSSVCYVYLEDCRWCLNADFLGVKGQTARSGYGSVDPCSKAQIEWCRWLTRGWTLQELIAPYQLLFLDQEWTQNVCKDVGEVICKSAFIPPDLVNAPAHQDRPKLTFSDFEDAQILNADRRRNLLHYTIAERMSWAAGRRTTRVEDTAYSLLGLFDVNLPLLYGEGVKAFTRLQKALIENSTDSSLFAWEDLGHTFNTRLLASSPLDFAIWRPRESPVKFDRSKHERTETLRRQAFSANNQGLSISLPLVDDDSSSDDRTGLPQDWDPRLSYHISYALLRGEVLAQGEVWQAALRLRHWIRDGEYEFSEVMAAPEEYDQIPRGNNPTLQHSTCGIVLARLSLRSSSEPSTSTRTRDLFILWDTWKP